MMSQSRRCAREYMIDNKGAAIQSYRNTLPNGCSALSMGLSI